MNHRESYGIGRMNWDMYQSRNFKSLEKNLVGGGGGKIVNLHRAMKK